MRATDNIQDCAKLYSTFLKKRYYVKLANGLTLEFEFSPTYFKHLLGLHKLKDISRLDGKSNNKIFEDILSGNIKQSTLRISNFYNKIADRIEHFEQIISMLDISKSNKLIINFDKNLVSNCKLNNTKFILYNRESVGYSMLTIAKDSKKYYPETFIYENGKRYINKQTLVDIVDICVKKIK